MPGDWNTFSLHPMLDEDNPATGNKHYEEMRQALLQFEGEYDRVGRAQERAFFAALRELLQESIQEQQADSRDVKLMAVHKWFTKSRPTCDWGKSLSAVLATSLSVVSVASPYSPVGAGPPLGQFGLHPPRDSPAPRSLVSRNADRHGLPTVYSREGAGGTDIPYRPTSHCPPDQRPYRTPDQQSHRTAEQSYRPAEQASYRQPEPRESPSPSPSFAPSLAPSSPHATSPSSPYAAPSSPHASVTSGANAFSFDRGGGASFDQDLPAEAQPDGQPVISHPAAPVVGISSSGAGLTPTRSMSRLAATPLGDMPFQQYPTCSTQSTRPTTSESLAVISAAAARRSAAAGLKHPAIFEASSRAGTTVGDRFAGRGAGSSRVDGGQDGSQGAAGYADGGTRGGGGAGGSRGRASATVGWRSNYRTDSHAVPPALGPASDAALAGRGSTPAAGRPGSTAGATHLDGTDVEALRAKMSQINKLGRGAQIQDAVAKWSLQRARLEEEIVQRHELASVAWAASEQTPSGRAFAAAVRDDDFDAAQAWRKELSAYGNMVPGDPGFQVAAPAHPYPNPLSSALLQTSFAERAKSAREAAQAEYAAEVAAIRLRSAPHGSRSSSGCSIATTAALERALMPVPDRPFIDCVGRLPIPGSHMLSRPSTVPNSSSARRRRKPGGGSAKGRRGTD